MLGYLKARRAGKRARRACELAVLDSLMAENQRRLAELSQVRECVICKALESPEEREVCEKAATR